MPATRLPLLVIATLGLLLLSLSGCLTVKELLSVKPNGSGSMDFLVEFDPWSGLLESEEDGQQPLPEDWSFANLQPVLSRLPGIRKVHLLDDPEQRRYGIRFKFADITALNRAMGRLLLEDSTEVFPFYAMENGVLIRKYRADRLRLPEAFVDRAESEDQVRAILARMDYEVEMTFRKTPAVVYTGAEGQLKGRRDRTLSLSASLHEVSERAEALQTIVVFE